MAIRQPQARDTKNGYKAMTSLEKERGLYD